MRSDPIRILYIGGYGRSGSTLVERALGQLDGFCAVGELRHVWERGFRDNQLCGCGQPFRACPFWREVVERAFGGFDRIDLPRMLRLAQSADRTRFIPCLLWRGSAGFERRVAAYGAALRGLYAAIRDVSGCRVVIDSSKEPSYAYLLRRVAGLDLSLLHLVRDSRAVAFSWVRKRERPEIHWTQAFMDVHAPLKSAALWMLFNALCHGLGALGCPTRRVHYEDFVADPTAVLQAVLADLGAGDAGLDFVRDQRLTLAPNHTVSGNPMRFAVGEVEVVLDHEWRARMAPADRRLMSALTYPLLRAYGYTAGPRALESARARQERTPAALGPERGVGG